MSYVVALDPGTANAGFALLEIETKKCVRTATYDIGRQWQCKANEAFVTQRTASVADTFLDGIKPAAFVTERNLKLPNNRALEVQGCAMLGYFCALGARVLMVAPMDVKKHFNLECKRSHYHNKTPVMERVEGLGYDLCGKDNHQADAILLGRYWIDTVSNYSEGVVCPSTPNNG